MCGKYPAHLYPVHFRVSELGCPDGRSYLNHSEPSSLWSTSLSHNYSRNKRGFNGNSSSWSNPDGGPIFPAPTIIALWALVSIDSNGKLGWSIPRLIPPSPWRLRISEPITLSCKVPIYYMVIYKAGSLKWGWRRLRWTQTFDALVSVQIVLISNTWKLDIHIKILTNYYHAS